MTAMNSMMRTSANMSVALISVPSRADMARGVGQCILHGVEYNISGDRVELTSADEIRLDKMIGYFNGHIIDRQNVVEITPELSRRENIRI